MNSDDLKLVETFAAQCTFHTADKNRVFFSRHPMDQDVELTLGGTYTATIRKTTYDVFLTNIEFKNKTFFSIAVDLYTGDSAFKQDIYFYNLAQVNQRTPRFPLKKETIRNNYDFWTSLQPADDIAAHHSDIEFFRLALAKNGDKSRGKRCRVDIRKTKRAAKNSIALLDRAKQKLTLPTNRIEYDAEQKSIIVYRLEKNRPMRRLIKLRVDDQFETRFVDNGPYFTQRVTQIDDDRIYILGAVKENGEESVHEFPYSSVASSAFWQNIRSRRRSKTLSK